MSWKGTEYLQIPGPHHPGLSSESCVPRGRDTRQEEVEGSPTQRRISPSIQRIPRIRSDLKTVPVQPRAATQEPVLPKVNFEKCYQKSTSLKASEMPKERPAKSLEPPWEQASRLQRCSGSAAKEQDLCKSVAATSKVCWATTLDSVPKVKTIHRRVSKLFGVGGGILATPRQQRSGWSARSPFRAETPHTKCS